MTHIPEREPVDRREHVQVSPVHEERVVHDVGAERRQILHRLTQFIWLFGGIVIGMIGIRFLLRLMAANPESGFARLVYGFTDLFLFPFFNLTATPTFNGAALEIFSIIAMMVYALFFWVIVKVVWLLFDQPRSRVVSTYERDPGHDDW